MNFSVLKFLVKLLFLNSFFFFFSSESLFFMWVCFELNMVLFAPLMNKNNHSMFNSMMKYYIIQSISSGLFLFSLIFNHFKTGENCVFIFIFMSMWMKLGLFPFNSWFFQISENMDWDLWFLLNSLQKLMPVWVLSFYVMDMFYLNYMILLNSFYSVVEVWGQISLRWIINSSSLNHFSWMIFSLNSEFSLMWEIYFLIYFLVFLCLCLFLKVFNWGSMLNSLSNESYFVGLSFSLIFFNFMGIPPFLGFLPKLILILNTKLVFVWVILFLSSVFMSVIYFNCMLILFMKSLMDKISQSFIKFVYLLNFFSVNILIIFVLFVLF